MKYCVTWSDWLLTLLSGHKSFYFLDTDIFILFGMTSQALLGSSGRHWNITLLLGSSWFLCSWVVEADDGFHLTGFFFLKPVVWMTWSSSTAEYFTYNWVRSLLKWELGQDTAQSLCVISRHTRVLQAQLGQMRIFSSVTDSSVGGKVLFRLLCSIDASSEQKQMFGIQTPMTLWFQEIVQVYTNKSLFYIYSVLGRKLFCP